MWWGGPTYFNSINTPYYSPWPAGPSWLGELTYLAQLGGVRGSGEILDEAKCMERLQVVPASPSSDGIEINRAMTPLPPGVLVPHPGWPVASPGLLGNSTLGPQAPMGPEDLCPFSTPIPHFPGDAGSLPPL